MRKRRQAVMSATAKHGAVDEIAALKRKFRSEDLELARQGRAQEVTERNRQLMGIKAGERGRLIGWNGKILKA